MSDEILLEALVSAWLERFIGGEDVPASTLCPDRPDLVSRLEERIEAHRQTLALIRAVGDTDSSSSASPGQTTALSGFEVPATLPSGITVPGYDVLAELGRGGMGTVYLARHLTLKRLVALKVLRADRVGDPEHRLRVRAEAQAIARLQHPHIVQIFDVGEWQGPGSEIPQPFLALEYLRCGSLENVLERQGALEPAQSVRLIEVLAHAVDTAHQAGIIHRDLKPANVLLAPPVAGSPDSFPFGFPKINDFGLARLLDADQRQTVDGQILGSPLYMAPEQADGRREVGPAADIWALGVILYECLTGQKPFRGESVLATFDLIRSSQPPHLHSPHGAIPAELEAICLRCLEKDPVARYPSAAALAGDLRRIGSGTPVDPQRSETQPGPPRRLGRHRVRLIAPALLTLVGVAAGVLALGPWGRAPRHFDEVSTGQQQPGLMPLPDLEGSIDILIYESALPGPDAFKPGDPDRQGLRLYDRRALPLRPNDWIRIEATLNRPAYLHVVWIDTDGTVLPLWPWDDGDSPKLPAEQAPRDRLTLPESVDGKDIMPRTGGPPGIEALLMLARETPLDPAENAELMKILSRRLPVQPLPRAETEFAVWLEDGERVTGEPTRGPIVSKAQSSGDPEAQVRQLMKRLQAIFSYTRAVCFGSQGKR
jgi:serine/threonine protein kinase